MVGGGGHLAARRSSGVLDNIPYEHLLEGRAKCVSLFSPGQRLSICIPEATQVGSKQTLSGMWLPPHC